MVALVEIDIICAIDEKQTLGFHCGIDCYGPDIITIPIINY
jgi:hypothetical protein